MPEKMKICPKCKQVYDDNSAFCEQCENEDGAGVRLVEAKDCPNCGKTIPKDAKCCIYCGVNTQNFAKDATNMDIHGNAVRGDLNITSTVHHDETYIDNTVVHNEVTNNSTTNIIHNDETTATSKCSVCGKIIKRIEGYECTKCGKFVCSDCYDDSEKMCTHCSPFTSAQKVSKVLEKFVKELRGYNVNDNAGWNFVEQYIIPNNKNDIKEFLVYCSSQRDALRSDDKKHISVLWNNKCLQLINQGEVAFPDDKLFQEFLKEKKSTSETFKERIRKENKIANQKRKAREERSERRMIVGEAIKNFFTALGKAIKNFFKWWGSRKLLGKIGVFYLVLIVIALGIMTPLEMIGDKKDERQLKKLKLQDEYIVSKENISFNGFLKNYIEVADDGVISFISGENNTNDICFTVNLKKKKGYLDYYEQQIREFKGTEFNQNKETVKIEKDYLETNLPGSLINRSNLRCKILDDVINKKVGDVFTVRIIQATSTKDLISVAKEPPKLVIITADPELQYIDENHNIVKREKLK